jgi:CheY-like chemotaxis protein
MPAMLEALKILVIDDSEDDRLLYRRNLKKSTRVVYDICETASGEEGLDRIDQENFACVLLDYSLPGRDGLEILKRIRAKHPFVPVVMLTGLGNEKIAVAVMQEGAQNYIAKAHIDPQTLPHVIEVAMRQCQMQSSIAEQRRSLEVFAHALAHDLKEPVRSIRTLLDLMHTELSLDGTASGHFQSIRSTAERMNSLIDTVYFYTRLDDAEPTKRETCGAHGLVDAAAQNISQLISERQAVILCPPLPRVSVNREQVIQVLQNLLANAIQNCAITPRRYRPKRRPVIACSGSATTARGSARRMPGSFSRHSSECRIMTGRVRDWVSPPARKSSNVMAERSGSNPMRQEVPILFSAPRK